MTGSSWFPWLSKWTGWWGFSRLGPLEWDAEPSDRPLGRLTGSFSKKLQGFSDGWRIWWEMILLLMQGQEDQWLCWWSPWWSQLQERKNSYVISCTLRSSNNYQHDKRSESHDRSIAANQHDKRTKEEVHEVWRIVTTCANHQNLWSSLYQWQGCTFYFQSIL